MEKAIDGTETRDLQRIFLLDTTACVALIRDQPLLARARAEEAIVRGEMLLVSSIVLHELWYGAAKSKRVDENTAKLGSFLSGYAETCAFDETDARRAGEIRAALEQKGETIAAYDTLIAGQCLSRNFTLVTGNVSEFRRVKGLRLEDWMK